MFTGDKAKTIWCVIELGNFQKAREASISTLKKITDIWNATKSHELEQRNTAKLKSNPNKIHVNLKEEALRWVKYAKLKKIIPYCEKVAPYSENLTRLSFIVLSNDKSLKLSFKKKSFMGKNRRCDKWTVLICIMYMSFLLFFSFCWDYESIHF